jgi:hypothetical protein
MACFAAVMAECRGREIHANAMGSSPAEAIGIAHLQLQSMCGGPIENFRVLDISCSGILDRELLSKHLGVSDSRYLPEERAQEDGQVCLYDGKEYSVGSSCPDGSGKTCRYDGTWL